MSSAPAQPNLANTQMELKISGMHCASCAANVQRSLKKQEGVSEAEVSYSNGRVQLEFDPKQVDLTQLQQVVDNLGYTLHTPEGPLATATSPSIEAANGQAASEPTPATSSKADSITQWQKESTTERNVYVQSLRKRLTLLLPLAAAMAVLMSWHVLMSFGLVSAIAPAVQTVLNWVLPLLAGYVLVNAGRPYLRGLWLFLKTGLGNMDALIGLGATTAYVYSLGLQLLQPWLVDYLPAKVLAQNYYDATIMLIAFVSLGKYWEEKARAQTSTAIESLIGLQAKQAWRLRVSQAQADGSYDLQQVDNIPLAQVQEGDILLVRPGEAVPVDGVVLSGDSWVNESLLSGEPVPLSKSAGSALFAASVNGSGALVMLAQKVGDATLLAQMIRLVDAAQSSKAPIQNLADKIAAIFVPVVLVLALLTVLAWVWLGTASLGEARALAYGLSCAIAVLVIACPCALGLATPTAITVAVGRAAREGILIRDAASLQALAQAQVVALDKTGTLTQGKPQLQGWHEVQPENSDGTSGRFQENQLLQIFCSLEAPSEHPLARALWAAGQERGLSVLPVQAWQSLPGKGVQGEVNGQLYLAGSAAWMRSLGMGLSQDSHGSWQEAAANGLTPLFLSDGKSVLAVALLGDSPKAEAQTAVQNLQHFGLKVAMLSGDNKASVQAVAKRLHVDTALGEVTPALKLQWIKEEQKQGNLVVMVGDGVNDAPALAQANVGVAMGNGSDVAIGSASLTLLRGDLLLLVQAIHLAKRTQSIIWQNLFWAFSYNLIGIPLAAGVFFAASGLLLNPAFAGAAMAFSSILVVLNALRINIKK